MQRRCNPPGVWTMVAFATVLAVANPGLGQIVPPFPGPFPPRPGGVFVDPDGVLRSRTVGGVNRPPRGKGRAGKDKASFVYVSLPRLTDAAKKAIAAGQPIPEAIRYLEGMTRVEYLFVYPEEKDLIIAGPAEPWDASEPLRPIGRVTGRPIALLDDLVVALRTAGPGSKAPTFGCSIDLPNEAISRMVDAARKIGAVGPGTDEGQVVRVVREAAGMQPIRIFGVAPDTPIAFTCLEADYTLKRLALGLQRSPVKKVPSHFGLMRVGEPIYSRYWFTLKYDPLLVSDDGLAYEIRGPGLMVRASDSPRGDDGNATASAKKFAAAVSDHFPELADRLPEFSSLRTAADLALFAALVRTDGLAEKTSWDVAWMLDPAGYPVPKAPTPTEAESLANAKLTGQTLLIAVGGVVLNPSQAAKTRESAPSDAFAGRAQRPSDGWMLRAPARP